MTPSCLLLKLGLSAFPPADLANLQFRFHVWFYGAENIKGFWPPNLDGFNTSQAWAKCGWLPHVGLSRELFRIITWNSSNEIYSERTCWSLNETFLYVLYLHRVDLFFNEAFMRSGWCSFHMLIKQSWIRFCFCNCKYRSLQITYPLRPGLEASDFSLWAWE